MKIGIGNDHASVDMKMKMMEYMTSKGYEVVDFGTASSDSIPENDYPIYGRKVAEAIISGEVEKGILICGTGVGISVSANKVRGIRACVCSDPMTARLTVEHNNANIIAFGSRIVGEELAKMILDQFFGAEYQGGRHQRRLDKIADIEADYMK